MCVSIITDESGVIWLKCNNTVQIWHNPAHPSNCPVEWQSGFNLPITVSDLSSFKILWSPRGMRGACNRICSLHVCRYISRYALAVFFPFCFFFYGGGGKNSAQTSIKTNMWAHICKAAYSSKATWRCEVYLTWKVRGFSLVYFATDISSQEKWVARKTRKWACWVEVTAGTDV